MKSLDVAIPTVSQLDIITADKAIMSVLTAKKSISDCSLGEFEILGMDDHRLMYPKWRGRGPDLNGKPVYRRIIIKRKELK